MNTGISTGCLYPMLTENSIRTLTSLGFRRFEIFVNSFSELQEDYLERLKTHLEGCGAKVVSLHPFTSSFESLLLFSYYERRFFDGISFYEMFFRAAQRLGAKMVILHGLNTQYRSTITDNEYFRRFALLQERASRFNVTLLQENVAKFRSRDLDFICRMKKEIPEHAAFVCDIKQAIRSGNDPVSVVQAMEENLRHIHISDNNEPDQCALPGKGCYDLESFIDYLIKIGYNGDIITEVYRFSFGSTDELIDADKYVNNLILNGRSDKV